MPEPVGLAARLRRGVLNDARRRELAGAVVAWVTGMFDYVPGETPVGRVPDGIGEQLMALSSLEDCVQASGHDLVWALANLSAFWMHRGALTSSRDAAQESRTLAERLAQADPHNAEAQRDLSIS